MSDRILIEQLRVQAIAGVHAWERRLPRALVFDLELHADLAAAGQSDRLRDTVDYQAVCDRVTQIAQDGLFQLIEALAEAVAAALLDEFKLQHVRVTVHKPGAVPAARSVAVTVERTRGT